jgi:predicted GIY-YIG superfamily endonuclease
LFFPSWQKLAGTTLVKISAMKKRSCHEEYWYVYVLRCRSGILHFGSTHDLVEGVLKHNRDLLRCAGYDLNLTLVGFTTFRDRQAALAYEQYLRGKSSRKKGVELELTG